MKKNIVSKMALLLFSFTICFTEIATAKLNCKFEPREDQFFLKNLPIEIKGYINCGVKSGLTVIYVARLKKTDLKSLTAWFKTYEDIAVPATTDTKVIEKKGIGTGSVWLRIESLREFDSVSDYLFTKKASGANYVFLSTYSPESALEVLPELKSAQKIITKPEFLSKIAKQIH